MTPTRRGVLAGTAALGAAAAARATPPHERDWWRRAVFYQVYPRSFMDSNGDGIGDLPGIGSHLNHIRRLGVDAVWLSPHFDSPDADNGYDIRDYRKVQPAFGTMADFDRLAAGLKARGIRLIVDLVVNHTSDEHDWFKRSRSSRDDPYRDFYIWRDGKGDGPPNNYPSFFGGPAWTRDDATGQWYLHYFHRKQPDLNWANPRVRAAVHDIARFWLARGVSGFRMDVIAFIAKQPGLPDLTPAELSRGAEYVYAAGPDLHGWLRDFRREVLDPGGAIAIGEAWGVSQAGVHDLVDPARGELDLVLASDVADVGRAGWRTKRWSVADLRAALDRTEAAPGPRGVATLFLGNHDYPRMLSHFGSDDPAWRSRSAQALSTLLLTRRAVPFVYQGDELGMANYPFTGIAQFRDVSARARWGELVATGREPAATVLRELGKTSRDNARTPMQWTARANGGFTTGTPWIGGNPDATTINAEAQWPDGGSVLRHYQRLIALRRRMPALHAGVLHDVAPEHPAVIAYTRIARSTGCLVAVNMSATAQALELPAGVRAGAVLLSGAGPAPVTRAHRVELAPWQSAVLALAA